MQFGFNPQVQRLWQLGSWTPYDSFVTKTKTLTVNVYGSRPDTTGGSISVSVSPSTSCVDADNIVIGVQPASCSTVSDISGNFYLTGYSYQKENLGYGQETWSFTSKPLLDSYSGTIVMLRGIAEGQIATGGGVMTASQMGVEVNDVASNDAYGAAIEGESGSVSAGTPGLGEYSVERYIVASAVGASIGRSAAVDGALGRASVQIPITPIYL